MNTTKLTLKSNKRQMKNLTNIIYIYIYVCISKWWHMTFHVGWEQPLNWDKDISNRTRKVNNFWEKRDKLRQSVCPKPKLSFTYGTKILSPLLSNYLKEKDLFFFFFFFSSQRYHIFKKKFNFHLKFENLKFPPNLIRNWNNVFKRLHIKK